MRLLLAVCLFFCTISLAGAEKIRAIFIHGWNPLNETHSDILDVLRKTYPDAEISIFKWDSTDRNFQNCVTNADRISVELADHLSKLPDETLHNTIIIGHSLGGRIAVRVMARLFERGKKIRYGVFLGSAIPDDDKDIALAIQASLRPNINIYNRQDYILRHVYLGYNLSFSRKKTAFGAFGYAGECKTSQLRQMGMAEDNTATNWQEYLNRIRKHSAFEYLTFLRNHFSVLNADYPEKIDSSTAAVKIKVSGGIDPSQLSLFLPDEVNRLAGSRILDRKQNWRLLHYLTYITREDVVWGKKIHIRVPVNLYYILDERDRIVYLHRFYNSAKAEFERIKAQL